MQNNAWAHNKFGQKIWINSNNHIGKAIIEKGIYDEHAIHYIEKILQQIPQPICLDIGAHIGNHALVMSKFSHMVYCFDPDPENVHALKCNQKENNILNMQIFDCGLSDKNEELIFYKQGSTFVSALKKDHSETETLFCKIGDEVLQQQCVKKIDFIKIDIEGFEARALSGLKQTIQASRPIIIMEWNNDTTRKQFEKYHLLKTVFKDYQILAISHNHHKSYWGKQWYKQFLRFFYRKIVPKQRKLCRFFPEISYANVILFPTEKAWVAEIR